MLNNVTAIVVALSSTAAQTSVQQDFEAASQLNSASQWDAALRAWEALEQRVADRPRSLALVRLRKATALLGLDRRDDAASAAEAGLAAIPTDDPTLQPDRYDAHTVLARIATSSLDYATAERQFAAARALAGNPTERLSSWWGQIDTGTFVDPEAALAIDAEHDAIVADLALSKDLRGQIMATRARLYLNAGDVKRARKASRDAVELMGGLTSQTDLADVSARALAALAAFRDGDQQEARRYLAMTGAGRSTDTSLQPPREFTPPPCGGDSGLQPTDSAIIEFSIAEDGTVFGASPIWSNRPGDAALIFARAARNWSWQPDQLAGLPAFYRHGVRVETRCSTAFERPSVIDLSSDALAEWLEGKGVKEVAVEGSAARRVTILRERLAAMDAAGTGDALAAAPLLYALTRSPVTSRDETRSAALRLNELLAGTDASAMARLAVNQPIWATAASDGASSNTYRDALDSALAAEPYASDPASRATIALLRADHARDSDSRIARTYVQRAANDPGLPDNHPIKVGALIRLASLDYRDGKLAEAQAAFARTGMSAEQCALLDKPPELRDQGVTFRSFPAAAILWGTEGWTRVEHDIAADGQVRNPRVVAAYPAYVFSDSAAGAFAKARYDATFRPGNDIGCGGVATNIIFQLPG